MAVFINIIIILLGLAIVAMGVKSIIKREAKFSLNEDSDEQRIVEGFPAVLVGLVEIAIGVCLIFFQRHPWSA